MAKTKKVDFDNYAGEYEKILDEDLEFFGEKNGYFAEYKVKIVKDSLSIEPAKILEYGCGIGLNLRYFTQYFPSSKISACDISEKSIEIASRDNSNVDFFIIDESSLHTREEEFDVIFVSCVFHHIAPELRSNSMNKIKKLLKPGGSLYLFEHNPYNPVTRKIVKDCIWDKDAILLNTKETVELMSKAGFEVTEKKFTLFFPSQMSFLRSLEKFLAYIPLGGQYYVRGIKK
ncbi:MAG: class I SAM-dependent methyltransferase [Bacteroidota bacterium]|nr:class I SAM-dependent methyltransferase [Bacteroidota bacterium]